MWGYYRADPAAYASSQRLCVYGIWPTGTAKGTDRWWSSPARTGYDRDPRQSDPNAFSYCFVSLYTFVKTEYSKISCLLSGYAFSFNAATRTASASLYFFK